MSGPSFWVQKRHYSPKTSSLFSPPPFLKGHVEKPATSSWENAGNFFSCLLPSPPVNNVRHAARWASSLLQFRMNGARKKVSITDKFRLRLNRKSGRESYRVILALTMKM